MEDKSSQDKGGSASSLPLATDSSHKKAKHNKQVVCLDENNCTSTSDGECSNHPHRTNEVAQECFMYNFGFCPNGPNCNYKYTKLPGPPPPVEEVLNIIKRHEASKNKSTYCQTICQHDSMASILPQGTLRYFVVKSNNLENLQLSVERGMWATQPRNESILNEAFHLCDNVILIFSVNQARHFHGCAIMASKIGGAVSQATWNDGYGHFKSFGKNFSVKWIKQCELPFQKTRHLRNPYNSDLPVKISRDCQQLEPSVGEELVSLLFLEKDVNFMVQ